MKAKEVATEILELLTEQDGPSNDIEAGAEMLALHLTAQGADGELMTAISTDQLIASAQLAQRYALLLIQIRADDPPARELLERSLDAEIERVGQRIIRPRAHRRPRSQRN